MATFTGNSGLPSAFNGSGGSRQPGGLWRPWTGGEDSLGKVSFGKVSALVSVCGSQKPKKVFLTFNPQARSSHGDQPLAKQPKTPPFVHPVR